MNSEHKRDGGRIYDEPGGAFFSLIPLGTNDVSHVPFVVYGSSGGNEFTLYLHARISTYMVSYDNAHNESGEKILRKRMNIYIRCSPE